MRADAIIALAARSQLKIVRRTALLAHRESNHDVVLLDTIGELGKVYSIGDIIFVGGSLIPHGGHNILEPAAHGKPILVGPHMFNFKDTYALFSGRGACDTVYDENDLAKKIRYILNNKQVWQAMSEQTLAIMKENQGAAYKSVMYLKEMLKKTV